MAQASVLTENDVRRVFRVIETTRYAERNCLAFVLSIYAGLRVGEIAALTTGDVVNQHSEARREIKLGAHQTKGAKGRSVILSTRVRKEIETFLKQRPTHSLDTPLIQSQRNRYAFSTVTLSMLFKEIYELSGPSDVVPFRQTDLRHAPKCEGGRNADNPKTHGSSAHQHDGALLRCFGRCPSQCCRVGLKKPGGDIFYRTYTKTPSIP